MSLNPEEGESTLPPYWPSHSMCPRKSSRLSELIDDSDSRLSNSEFSSSRSGNPMTKSTLEKKQKNFIIQNSYFETRRWYNTTLTISAHFSCLMDLILSSRVFSVSSVCMCAGTCSSEGWSAICTDITVVVINEATDLISKMSLCYEFLFVYTEHLTL